MNSLLFERATGNLGANVFAKLEIIRLLRSFQPALHLRFDGGQRGFATRNGQPSSSSGSMGENGDQDTSLWAHQAGVNALALDRFDGRILISGGADATIKLWDLEKCANPHQPHVFKPVVHIARASLDSKSEAHRFGITQISFYPFDQNAFLSSSYDNTLKLWQTDNGLLSGSWDLGSKLYTHAISPVAEHLLVACGTAHPAVRLVDLRSNAAVQSLVAPGQINGGGAVLALSWSPRHEHVLASGTLDGAVRLWDVRRANSLLGLLDQEDSMGIMSRGGDPNSSSIRNRGHRLSAKAHTGPVNGLTWTDDGAYIISAGHDRRIRVWDAATSANTLASFGPSIRNGQLSHVPMFTTPVGLTRPKRELLFWPNETEILVMELHEGTIVNRLRGVGASGTGVQSQRGGERSVKNRVTSIVWRGAGGIGGSNGVVLGGSNAPGGVCSGHSDGRIRVWMPRLQGDDKEGADDESSLHKTGHKRKAIDDAFNSLMGRKITFT